VVDAIGFVSSEFGSEVPVFQVSALMLDDGTKIRLEGEHDIAYIPTHDKFKDINLDEETLVRLREESEGDDGR
jgi:hypothetical protein